MRAAQAQVTAPANLGQGEALNVVLQEEAYNSSKASHQITEYLLYWMATGLFILEKIKILILPILTSTQQLFSLLLNSLEKRQVSEDSSSACAFDRTDERASFYVSFVGKEERFQNRFQNKSSNYKSQHETLRVGGTRRGC